jgi:predicted ATPase/class 3 adenylate cyclase
MLSDSLRVISSGRTARTVMKCPKCGFANFASQRQCGNCGAALINHVACSACGSKNLAAQNYCGQCGADLRSAAANGASRQTATPERRHLTIMFCDLVGSTALSERLDPEELGDLILAYREVAAAAISRFGGYVARYVGDGILAYFGYPRAHDDDPVRAVHAAIEILAGMRELTQMPERTKRTDMPARIGVHTGLVVVGDLAHGAVREEAGAVGEAPNLAARLIEVAPPNSILVSGVTHAMIKDHFECREFRATRFKGLSRPITVFEVNRVRTQESVVEPGRSIEGLAGREGELAFLNTRWSQVVQGAGQVVSIFGEPGIGKSRLVRAFADGLAGTDYLRIVLNCSPYFSNTALYPIINHLNRWLEKSSVDKLDQLAHVVEAVGMSQVEIVPVVGSLLSLPIVPPYQSSQISARLQRERTMEFLLNWITRQAADRPALLVVEDLHWSDATSQELILSLINQSQKIKILLLLTMRPEFHSSWTVPAHVAHVPLDRLTTSQVHRIMNDITSGKHLPVSIRDQLVERADGVPLFVEELTKAVIESKALVEREDGFELLESSIGFDIPVSLHATLMARLDSLSSGKLVAQRAAVIGREFDYNLIAEIMGTPTDELQQGLAQLVEAELLFQRGLPPQASYIFKHSLIQEAAYHSLLRSKRKEHHRQIAEVLISKFQQLSETRPELVAHHYSVAQMGIAAAGYWRKAGELALARSAIVEACAHINKGLGELATSVKSALRIKEEVTLLIALGAALTALKGYASPEVERTYARASDLCRELNDPSHLFPVLRGLQSFYIVRGPLHVAHDIVEQLRRMAEQTGDSLQRVEAYRRLGWCLFCMGNIDAGRTYIYQAIQEYDRSRSDQHIVMYGSDPGVIGLVNLAWLEWFAGHSGNAKRYSNQSITLARELSFGLGLAYALGMSAALYQCLNDPQMTAELAEETIDLAEMYGFPYWVAWETSLVGWSRVMHGDIDAGLEAMQSGLAAYRDTGAELFSPYMLGLLAEVNLRARRFDRALAYCDEALASGERTDVHFFDAEIHRFEGECALGRDRNVAAAETCFHEAITLARKQGARMLELRSVTSLAKLRHFQGQVDVASCLLSEAVARVDRHESVPDLIEAHRLLRDWHGAA